MSKPVSVEVYTSSHRILGRVEAGPTGLYSHLNLPTTSIIEVDGAHLNRLHQPGRLVSRYTSMWLVKREIVAVLLSNRAEVLIHGRRSPLLGRVCMNACMVDVTDIPGPDPVGQGRGALHLPGGGVKQIIHEKKIVIGRLLSSKFMKW